jgi:hypothetical protein
MNDHDGEPRPGLPGAWDRLVGPGATALENLGTAGAALFGAAIGATSGAPAWSRDPIRRGAAAVIGLDLFGGVWANATPAATRWYHGRGQGTREIVAFSALHLHPFLVAALYRDQDWRFAWGNYAYLLAATAAAASTPASLRRAAALALCCGGVWLNTAVWPPTRGMGWFAPAFFLKLLVSHAAGGTPK